MPDNEGIRTRFIGREAERERLYSSLSRTMVKKGGLTLISGEAGIGKSRLTEDFIQKALSANCICTSGCCLPGKPLPYLPFIEATQKDAAMTNSGDTDFFPLVKKKSEYLFSSENYRCREDAKQIIDVSWSPDRILFAVLDYFKKRSLIRPFVVLIEDLQWADSQSIQLLHFLARNAKNERFLIIGTYRTEELLPAAQPTNNMFDTLRLMRREGLVEELELKGLPPEQVGELVNEILGDDVDSHVIERVVIESDGNPLYAIETTRVLEASDAISMINGVWRITPGSKFVVPPTIREILLRRIESLSRSQRNILDIASVVGFHFDAEIIENLLHIPTFELFEDLDKMETQYELIGEIDTGYKFQHQIFQQIIYESISSLKRKELHRLIGGFLENRAFTGRMATLAFHFREAHDDVKFVKYAICAGEEFAAKGAESDAINFFNDSLSIINTNPELDAYWVRAVSGLGYANNIVGNVDDSKKNLDALVQRVGMEHIEPRVLRIMAENNLAYGINEGTMEFLNQAENRALGDPNEMAEIKADKATLFLWQGNFKRAEECFNKAIEWSLQGDNTNLTTRLFCYLCDVYLTQGKIELALPTVEKAIKIAETTPNFYGEMEAEYYSGMVYFHIGDWREAVERLKKSIEIANKIGQLSSNCWSSINLSLVYDSIGDTQSALSAARKGLEFSREIQSKYAMLLGLSGVLHSLLRKGIVEEATVILQEAVSLEKEIAWSLHSTTRCLFVASHAEYLFCTGDHLGSDETFNNAFDLMKDTPNGLLLEAMARIWYGELLVGIGSKDRALDQFDKSKFLFEKLFNYPQVERVRWLINSVV